MMQRRTFLKGLVGAATLALVPLPEFAPEQKYILWGDGYHDDAPALQALFDGKHEQVEVRNDRVRVEGDSVHLGGGTYRLGDTIDLTRLSNSSIIGCHFTTDTAPVAIHGVSGGTLRAM